MNREIKFRAWNKQEKKMLELIMGVWIEDEWPEGKIESSTAFEWPDVYHVMQYTGLLDKNGKEIYEGDLVECPGFIRGKIHVIKYRDGRFVFPAMQGISDRDPSIERPELCGVVGNIFENIDLVGKEEKHGYLKISGGIQKEISGEEAIKEAQQQMMEYYLR